MVSVTGPYAGTVALGVNPSGAGAPAGAVRPGDYAVRIDATSPWSVKVSQPVWMSADSGALFGTGQGDALSDTVNLQEGVYEVELSHAGASAFAARLLAPDGTVAETLADTQGPYNGVSIIGVGPGASAQPGIYAISIRADGAWEISARP